jgi:hypothetical protein
LVDCDRERPDALARIDGDLVGIEVTTVVEAEPRQKTVPQQWRAEVSRLAGKAQKVAEATGREPVIAWLTFRPDWKPGAVHSDTLAAEVVHTVYGLLAQARLPNQPVTERDPHPALSSLWVVKSAHGNHWRAGIVSNIGPASADDIRATVRKKEVDLAAYKSVAPRVWLLIDCDLTGQGEALDVPEPFAMETGFERILCCGFGMWQWAEIQAMQRPAPVE